MASLRKTVWYSAPECERQEGWLGELLCSSPEGGQSEDVGFEDWTI